MFAWELFTLVKKETEGDGRVYHLRMECNHIVCVFICCYFVICILQQICCRRRLTREGPSFLYRMQHGNHYMSDTALEM